MVDVIGCPIERAEHWRHDAALVVAKMVLVALARQEHMSEFMCHDRGERADVTTADNDPVAPVGVPSVDVRTGIHDAHGNLSIISLSDDDAHACPHFFCRDHALHFSLGRRQARVVESVGDFCQQLLAGATAQSRNQDQHGLHEVNPANQDAGVRDHRAGQSRVPAPGPGERIRASRVVGVVGATLQAPRRLVDQPGRELGAVPASPPLRIVLRRPRAEDVPSARVAPGQREDVPPVAIAPPCIWRGEATYHSVTRRAAEPRPGRRPSGHRALARLLRSRHRASAARFADEPLRAYPRSSGGAGHDAPQVLGSEVAAGQDRRHALAR